MLLSSHVLGQVAQTVEEVGVIRSGRVVLQAPLDGLTSSLGGGADGPTVAQSLAAAGAWAVGLAALARVRFIGRDVT